MKKKELTPLSSSPTYQGPCARVLDCVVAWLGTKDAESAK